MPEEVLVYHPGLPEDERGTTQDIETIRRQFEDKWKEFLSTRAVIEQPNGGKTIIEAYRIKNSHPNWEDRDHIIEELIDFGVKASILGYRSSIAPITVSEIITDPDGSPILLEAYCFFLERTELPST